MIDLLKLIDYQYILDPRPSYNFTFFEPLLIVFGTFLVFGIAISLVRKWQDIVWAGPLAQLLRWIGFLGALLTFFRYQGVPFFSMRLWYYLLMCSFLIWLVSIIRSSRIRLSQQEQESVRQETYEKYLPRPKRIRVKS